MHIENKNNSLDVELHHAADVDVNNKKYLTAKDVANMIGKHPKWLERKRWEGGGPAFRYLGKTPIYEEKDVLNWLDSIPKITNTSQPH